MIRTYYGVRDYNGKCADPQCCTDNEPFFTHINVDKCTAHQSCTVKALIIADSILKCGFCKKVVDASTHLRRDELKAKRQESEFAKSVQMLAGVTDEYDDRTSILFM